MQFKTLALPALAAVASAQQVNPAGLLNDLPADLQSYVGGLITNTAVVGAVEGLVTNSAVQSALGGIQTAGANPTQFVQDLEAAVSQAVAAAPSDQRAIITSVVGVVTSDIATDGLLSSFGAIATGAGSAVSGGARPTGGAMGGSMNGTSGMGAAGSSGSGAGASTSGRSPSAGGPSTGAAANPTYAMGAFVGAIAGVAALL